MTMRTKVRTMEFTLIEYIVAWGTVIAIIALIVMAIYDFAGWIQRLFGRIDNSHNDVLVQQMFADEVHVHRDPTSPEYGAVHNAAQMIERRRR